MTSSTWHILPAGLALLALALTAGSCGDDDPVKPTPLPTISLFQADPDDIAPGDSSLISYQVAGADSVKLFPDGSKLSPVESGSLWVKPPRPATYLLFAHNEAGTVSASLTITMATVIPELALFALSENRILGGESTVLTWKAVLADSIVVDNGVGKLANPDSGQVSLTPVSTTTYTAIAYNDIASDTAAVTAVVEIPAAIEAPNGLYYKGIMGGGVVSPVLAFQVVDDIGNGLTLPWMHFSTVQGDGALSADSAQGTGLLNYFFSGSLGHGVIRATSTGVGSLDVQARANAIIPGAGGQGQYVLFSDIYADVKSLNGLPLSVDEDENYWLNYANYETALGVVVMIEDVDSSHNAEDTEPVIGVIFTYNFTGARTADNIGIGSTIDEVRAIYGAADSSFLDTMPPPAQAFMYPDEGLTFYTQLSGDSAVVEMHVREVMSPMTPELKSDPESAMESKAVAAGYRRRPAPEPH